MWPNNQVTRIAARSSQPSWMLMAALAVLAAFSGCGPQADSPPSPPAGDVAGEPSSAALGELPPGQLLSRMIGAYQSAEAYCDTGQLKLRQKQGDRWVEELADFSVAFRRPNRLLVRAYQATVGCDGNELRARITDKPSGDLDGQVVVRPAPAKITLGDLYQPGENLDPVLAEAFAGDLGVVPVTLNLLLAEGQPLAELLESAPPLERLPDATIGEHSCVRVAVGTQSGNLVFWIDARTWALRRLEYPASQLSAPAGEGVESPQVELVAEFGDVRFEPQLPDTTFAWDVPATAKKVRYFVIPPLPLPTTLFAKPVGDFWFSDLKGDRLSRRDLSGKIAVLIWYQDHPACRQLLVQFEKVYRRLKDNDRLTFRVVSVEGPARSHQEVQAVLDRWGVSIPAVRDVVPCGPDVFQIKDAPTLVILDADGVLQFCEVGANPYLSSQLPDLLARLQAGDRLADEILAAHEERQRVYVDQLELAMSQQPTTVVPLAEASLAKRKDPEKLRLTRIWCSTDVKAAGNILAVDRGSDDLRFYVLDGWQSVTEINRRGDRVTHHKLSLPPNAAVSRLRTAVDGKGRRWFAGFEARGQQVYLWDDQWQLAWSYPDGKERHEGLADVRIADLAGSGVLQMLVGFWGPVGVHGISWEGRREWGCREMTAIVSLAVSLPDEIGSRQLLVTSDQGPILPLNRFGNTYPQKRAGRWPIHVLSTAEFPSPKVAPYCGLSYTAEGGVVAVGINGAMEDVWNYPLPAGTFRTQIEPVTSAALLPAAAGCWLFAAPDGTVHFVAEDGQFSDQFAYGIHITGLAAARLGETGVLVLTSGAGPVECFQVARP